MKRFLFAVAAAMVLMVAGSAVAARSAGSVRGVVVARQHGVLLVASARVWFGWCLGGRGLVSGCWCVAADSSVSLAARSVR